MGHPRNYTPALFAIAILSCCCLPAFSQSAHDRQLLAHLSSADDDLRHKLPNFSCDESVLSEEVQHGKVRRHATFTATIRAQRNSKGVLEEKLGTQIYDVGVFSAIFHHVPSLPIYVIGGFTQALAYFSAADQPCMQYKISGSRIDFASISPQPPPCTNSNTTGFALLDADGNVIHLERTVTQETAVARGQAQFAAVDLAPVAFNNQLFRLSRHVVAEMPADNGVIRRFTADFSHCKLFTATITVSPTGNVIPPGRNP